MGPISNIPRIFGCAMNPRACEPENPPAPEPSVGLWHEGMHQAARAAPVASRLADFVATNGLHPSAREQGLPNDSAAQFQAVMDQLVGKD
jgi:hypothetical protein